MNGKARKKARGSASGASSKDAAGKGKSMFRSVAGRGEELEKQVELLSVANRQLKRKIFDLYTVFEVTRNFNAVLDYDQLLDSFVFTCLGQIGAQKGMIFLRKNDHDDRFYPAKSRGWGELPRPDQFFSAESRLAKYLTKLNRPVPTNELLRGPATPEEAAILNGFESGIVVPLIYQTRLSGIFAMAERISGREFSADDVEFLSILGNQIGVAIENARLYEGEKTAAKQLRTAQQQLLQTERIAALGEMSAKIAHEVNNPLGIIKNYMLLLRRATEHDVEAGQYAEVVGQEIDRIAGIVRQLLEFHHPGSAAAVPVDVVGVLGDVLALMEQPLSSRSIFLTRRFPSERPRVQGSAEGLKQVFLNLIINARDAMEDGGRLEISVTRKGQNLLISFSDTGPGIPPDLIPRLFEPFFSTKGVGEGTGLGLSVCYGIIKNHHGSITFSNLDPGGCFEIQLPVMIEKRVRNVSA